MTWNPHSEYHRQAAEHFGERPNAMPPRIHRNEYTVEPAADRPPPTLRADATDPPTERIRVDASEQPTMVLPTKFSAGTTYSSPSGRSGATEPRIYSPPPVAPPPPPIAPPPRHPTAAPPSVPEEDPDPSASPVTVGLNVQPHQAMWVLTGFSAFGALFSGLGWIVVVGACAFWARQLQARSTGWPPDLEEVLVRARLTHPSRGHSFTTAAPSVPFTYIPFRPMTIGELFGGAFKVVAKNWPTLLGIPLAILTAFAFTLAVVMLIAIQIMSSSLDSLLGSDPSLGAVGSWLVVMLVAVCLLFVMVALPTDALLIGLTVIATDKAIRGERTRLAEVFTQARSRMLAVCRLTAVYYVAFIVIDILVYATIFSLALVFLPAIFPLALVIFAALFAIGVMFSLAPVVLVMEGRGVIDSFTRSLQMAKVAWPRLVGIHLLWTVCALPLTLIVMMIAIPLGALGVVVFGAVAIVLLSALTRTLQMLVYTDLRVRQEGYDHVLLAEWTRRTQHR